jgi:hypothetical protein
MLWGHLLDKRKSCGEKTQGMEESALLQKGATKSNGMVDQLARSTLVNSFSCLFPAPTNTLCVDELQFVGFLRMENSPSYHDGTFCSCCSYPSQLHPRNKVYWLWLTLTVSMFSHSNGAHLAFNMFALWGFGSLVHQALGREEFLALYLMSGLSASFASHVFRVMMGSFTYAINDYPKSICRPSIGASGAVYGIVGYYAMIRPTAKILLLFSIPMQIKTGVISLAAFDAV